MAIIEAEDLAAEADGKGLDLDAGPARDQKVAEFMNEHDHGQDEQERQQDGKKAPQPANSLIENSHINASPSPGLLRLPAGAIKRICSCPVPTIQRQLRAAV